MTSKRTPTAPRPGIHGSKLRLLDFVEVPSFSEISFGKRSRRRLVLFSEIFLAGPVGESTSELICRLPGRVLCSDICTRRYDPPSFSAQDASNGIRLTTLTTVTNFHHIRGNVDQSETRLYKKMCKKISLRGNSDKQKCGQLKEILRSTFIFPIDRIELISTVFP